jgi:hypothetical protein
LFETTKTIGQVLVGSLIELLNKNGIRKNIIAYVKDEGSNFNVMINALESIMNYEYFNLEDFFKEICFDHIFSKVC